MKTSKKHIIIESESAYYYCRNTLYPNSNIVWHVTSPWLLEKLPQLNETVMSLEKDISLKNQMEMGKHSIALGDFIAHEIDLLFGSFNLSYKLGRALTHRIQVTLFPFFYKSEMLKNWFDKYKNQGELIVIGNHKLKSVESFDIMVGRFDNIFANLAHFSNEGGIKVVPFIQEDGAEITEQIDRINNISLGEKVLYVINNLSFYEVLKILIRKITKINFSFSPWFNNKDLHLVSVVKKCALIDESIDYLSKANFKVSIDTKFVDSIQNHSTKPPFDISYLKKIFDDGKKNILSSPNNFLNSSIDVILHRTYSALGYGYDFVENQKVFEKFIHGKPSNISVLTNGLSQPKERLFQQILLNNKISIFSCEHGVTVGTDNTMSKYYYERGLYTHGGDHMMCYSNSSFRAINKNRRVKSGIVAGAPLVNQKIKYIALQRLIIQRYLKLPKRKRVIVFVDNLNRNNMLTPPVFMNDLEYYSVTKNILSNIFSKINDQCILKLYPANRYLDPDPFVNLVKISKNIKVIQYFDFSELRVVADVVILSSPQSTFGWVFSIKKPIIFIEVASKPIDKNVSELFKKSLFLIDASKDQWHNEVLELLRLPPKELLRLWNDKKQYLDELETYIFGPKGVPGKKVADYIVKNEQSL